ncbi:MAG: MarR family winged helix-turn-helix transcriptional regulator [bacterium]
MERFDDSLGFLMTRTARCMKRALESRLAGHGITSSQYAVLYRLWEEDGLSLTELGKKLYFDNPTITGVVDRMERDNLVNRERNNEDRRVIKIFLTSRGKELKDVLIPLGPEVNRLATTNFSSEEKDRLKSFLERVWENIEG